MKVISITVGAMVCAGLVAVAFFLQDHSGVKPVVTDGGQTPIEHRFESSSHQVPAGSTEPPAQAMESRISPPDISTEVQVDIERRDDAEPVAMASPGANAGDMARHPAPPEPVEARQSIAIAPFEVLGSMPESDQLGEMLAEVLTAEIDSERYEIRERRRLHSLIDEMDLQAALGGNSADTTARLGKLARVDYVLTGSIGRMGGCYYLSARLMNCGSSYSTISNRAWLEFQSLRDIPAKTVELVNVLGLRRGDAKQSCDADGVDQTAATESGDLISAANAEKTFRLSLTCVEGKHAYAEGETISFKVVSERDCYITLVTVDSEGKQTLLLPNRWMPRTFVRRGRPVIIPDAAWGFEFPIGPPHGRTLVKAIATLRPLRLAGVSDELIDQKGFVDATKDGFRALGLQDTTGQTEFPTAEMLEKSLAEQLAGTEWATCEIEVVTYDTTD